MSKKKRFRALEREIVRLNGRVSKLEESVAFLTDMLGLNDEEKGELVETTDFFFNADDRKRMN